MSTIGRREFLSAAVAVGAGAGVARSSWFQDDAAAEVMTVTGAIGAGELGTTLPHEHVLVDFVGADRVSPERYDREEAFQVILPHLKRVRELGCQALVECTPAYLGRDPQLLVRLSQASGLRLLTNTGYYGASEGKFLPRHAFEEDANQLAERWVHEWQNGIDGTQIRPGFIKIGVDAGPLREVNRKIVQAAARAHLRSGLTIAAHTGDGRAALEQLEILREENVDPSAWIWVHAQNEMESAVRREVAERGAWVSLDGIAPESFDRHREMVLDLKRAELLERVLISHDAGWYSVGEPGGGAYRSYETLFSEFLPAAREAGMSAMELDMLTVTNPANAFTVSVRRS